GEGCNMSQKDKDLNNVTNEETTDASREEIERRNRTASDEQSTSRDSDGRDPYGNRGDDRLYGSAEMSTHMKSDMPPGAGDHGGLDYRSEEHTSELQSRFDLVCRLLLEKKTRHDHTECDK